MRMFEEIISKMSSSSGDLRIYATPDAYTCSSFSSPPIHRLQLGLIVPWRTKALNQPLHFQNSKQHLVVGLLSVRVMSRGLTCSHSDIQNLLRALSPWPKSVTNVCQARLPLLGTAESENL